MRNDKEEFSTLMKFRNIYYTQDGGLVLLAEKYRYYWYTSQSYVSGAAGSGGRWESYTVSVYECDDLLMCKINPDMSIGWLNVLPKKQRESYRMSGTSAMTFSFTSFFDDRNKPFYAGFGSMQHNSNIYLFMNDNPRNAAVLKAGQSVKRTTRFGKSDNFVITLDEKTGKYTRKMLFTNSDVPTSMPRLGAVFGKDMFIVGKDDRIMAKSKIAVGKISLK